MAAVATTSAERLIATDAHEGPVYVASEDALYFTTQRAPGTAPRVDIRRLDLATLEVTTVRADANVANGMAADARGRLIVCEQGTHSRPAAITRFDPRTGDVETLVDAFLGSRLNSPNDVVVKSDGTIWFTDPSYGHLQGFRPPPHTGDQVYRYDPGSDALSVVAETFDKPNGLAFSPDEAILYVGDNGAPQHIKAYDVVRGRRLEGERLFATMAPGHPDGLKTDDAGRVYASTPTGVQIFAPSGAPLGEIAVPGAVNFTFGAGERSHVLFITADDAIWAAALDAAGH
jgi:gluconolactonase